MVICCFRYSKRNRAIKEINSSEQSSDVEKYKLFKSLFDPQDNNRSSAKSNEVQKFGAVTVCN
jgi:hypothetical protein